MNKQIADLRFDLLRNALYHTARGQFFDWCMRALNFLVIVLGATAISDWVPNAKLLAGGAALAGAIQLVADFSGLARLHGYLQRRCYELLSELETETEPTEKKIAAIRGKLTALYGEEPPPMRALDAIAYNAACDSVGKSDGRVRVAWWQWILSNFWPFNGTEFVPVRS
jgi:hypothetical protein